MSDRLPIELARLLADGATSHQRLVEVTAELTGAAGSDRLSSGESNGSLVGALARKAMQPLVRAGIAHRNGDQWVVDDPAELARITGQELACADCSDQGFVDDPTGETGMADCANCKPIAWA